ncbi:MAG TPA: hypothetical protein PKD75_10960 [Tepidiformaceae bacterium]|nr:hypothetical protein [Tepidiformaceae bacterium]
MTRESRANGPADVDAWKAKLAPIDERAFELAIERWRTGSPLEPAMRAEAERAQQELRELARELRTSHPGVYDRLSDTISEALLDLKYALTAPQAVSLRLNQYMDTNPRNG